LGRGTERILSSEDRSQRREYIRGWGIGKGHGEEEEVKRFFSKPSYENTNIRRDGVP
tara:strand:+ start:260 stop:430 length:171 start_codon:yes stop_codon:yes gene_type:complete